MDAARFRPVCEINHLATPRPVRLEDGIEDLYAGSVVTSDHNYLTQALNQRIRGIQPSFMVSGKLGEQPFELISRPDERRGTAVDGHLGSCSLELDLHGSAESRRGAGIGLGGPVEFQILPTEGGKRLQGYVGKRELRLDARTWGPTLQIEGRVGKERVVLTQWNQFDGHMVSGYIGNRNVSLQARALPGQQRLDPLEYLPLLMAPPDTPLGIAPSVSTRLDPSY